MIGRFMVCDFETFSATDIASCGSFKYMEDPSFEILLLAYAFDDEPVRVVDVCSGESWPTDFRGALTDPEITKVAHNAAFERYAIRRALGIYSPPEEWFDTMHLAAQCGLPLSLDAVGKALGFDEDQAKMREGKALIRYFCVPCKPTKANGKRTRNLPEHEPGKWQTFKEYCRRDVETERLIYHTLEHWMPSDIERKFWCLDARINEKGMRVDLPLVRHAIEMDALYKAELTERAIAISGMENPNSVAQIKKWLYEQEGVTVTSLNKKVVADVVKELSTDKAKEFMAIRSRLAKSSTKKYEAMERSVCEDGTVKGCFQFYGATRTGRFSGRLVQLQNLYRNEMSDLAVARSLVRDNDYETVRLLYDDVSTTLSELIRTALIPEPGCRWIVADFSAIEARVIAWIAGEEWVLEAFRKGRDIYCETASMMFKVPVVKHGENGELRQKGKIATLACGFGGGMNSLKAFGADKMGMTDEEMVKTVDLWRDASPNICALWRTLEKAAARCIVHRTAQRAGKTGILFEYENGTLWMTLPSRRRLAYFDARYETNPFHPDRRSISYMGVDQKTKKWSRVFTWGGKLTENCWAAGTPVLTACGWKAIEEIQPHELVFDGFDWVECGGAIDRGTKETIGLNGRRVTPDHLILTEEGWKRAEEADGLDRTKIRNPDRAWIVRTERLSREMAMGCAVRLWPCSQCGFPRPQNCQILWLPDPADHLREPKDTWDDKPSGVWRMAQHGSTLHRADASSVEELRGPWHHCLRALAAQLRELLGRYGSVLRAGPRTGSKRQRCRVLSGELPVGSAEGQLPEQADQPICEDKPRTDDCRGTLREDGNRSYYAPLQDGPRSDRRLTVDNTRRYEPVYDLLNCGPRHSFVIACDGGPLIVHNCVQATARDCLRDVMLKLDAAGFDIRAHVHDEVLLSVPEGEHTVEEVCDIMGEELPWAPGLPLRADGYECPFYMKD